MSHDCADPNALVYPISRRDGGQKKKTNLVLSLRPVPGPVICWHRITLLEHGLFPVDRHIIIQDNIQVPKTREEISQRLCDLIFQHKSGRQLREVLESKYRAPLCQTLLSEGGSSPLMPMTKKALYTTQVAQSFPHEPTLGHLGGCAPKDLPDISTGGPVRILERPQRWPPTYHLAQQVPCRGSGREPFAIRRNSFLGSDSRWKASRVDSCTASEHSAYPQSRWCALRHTGKKPASECRRESA
ncbi:hypothetical protein GGR54DRAFT_393401 [Hypoxylon sp. NC1633]|nr:hypothetical protein GGR54DRAFT_393401 [Hypoxylon sp. NC1633]